MEIDRHPRLVRKLLGRAWSPYVGLAVFLSGAEIVAFVITARALGVDPESWPCIVVATPLCLVAWCVNFLGGTVLFVRAFARRKGRAKAVHHLFPDAEAGEPEAISRVLLKLAGL